MRDAMNLSDRAAVETVIEPPKGWQMIDFKELLAYRDLLIFLVKRDITVLYAQTVLGFVWAVVNPLIQIVVFSIIFGRIAKLDSEGMPYFLFSAVAIIPWTYMSDTMSAASQSLVGGQSMLGKVYFPRIIFPLTPIFAKLMDFGISLLLLVSVMIYFRVVPTWNLLLLPLFVLMMMSIPAGVGFWLASLAVRFRDVKFAMPFIVRMLIYSAPILYSAAKIPADYRFWYSMNPVVGVVEGFRACLLGTAIPWEFIVPGMLTTVLLIATGAMYFRRMERIVVDVI